MRMHPPSGESLRTIIERSPDAIVVHRAGRIVYLNEATSETLSYSPEELVGDHVAKLIHPDDRPTVAERVERVTAGERLEPLEERFIAKDGRVIHAEVIAIPIAYDGAPASLVVARNLSTRKRLESQMRLTERMASLGTLAGGIAHEINNPISWVRGDLEFVTGELERLREDIPPERRARVAEMLDALGDARDGTSRVERIVSDLQLFARGVDDDDEPQEVELGAALESSLSLVGNEIRQRARLDTRYLAEARITAAPGKVTQLFVSLLLNAAQAIAEDAEDAAVEVVLDREGDFARVEVRDTGCGIPDEHHEHLFDPFFTSKQPGVATGLGLTIAHSIVTALGGAIDLESEVGAGTTARVTLPVAETETPTPPPAHHAAATASSLRLLVVDDEPPVGRAIRRLLRRHHSVEVFDDPWDALDRLMSGARYGAVLCDLMMPGLTGMDLYERVRKAAPDQADRFVFVTGGPFTRQAERFVDETTQPIVHKPFDSDSLHEAIGAVQPASGTKPSSGGDG